ncbi:phosphoenolpyruvate-protein phosphotransferase PtsI [Endozoicomonas sp. 8E]|uniref:phosphoenolpyruvate-protein phosphotransferase PtsI n=1 Tax=Endozoicomonas sp. 8E TaxID=3035692 RepID=UPI00293931B9|nr:phosphoenolpyruvate-protein phosphotransferase PtsI [Endozoicomonas sp. 8E]WOG29509.1 phosphoenolpyruvate-protein phosphotransferase PtsI [Endozoicomonas sp. 8E]
MGKIMFSGIIASSGVAIGNAFVLKEVEIQISDGVLDNSEVEADITRFRQARDRTVEQLEAIRSKTAGKLGEEEAEVFEGHILVATDEELEEEVISAIRSLKPADAALNDAIMANVSMLEELDDPYLRERVADIKDVGRRMLKNLLGIPVTSLEEVEEGSIIIADDLTPSDTSQIDLERVWGFVTNVGGRTSHSAIMARSLELPAIVGARVATDRIQSGDQVILDAVNNKVLVNPDASALDYYRTLQKQLDEERIELTKLKDVPCETLDGKAFEVCANIGTVKDIEGADRHGAEGVGLYRTEFLFMDRTQMPSEEEQFEAYKAVAEAMGGRPVIIRTLDIGGDKELSYLDLPEELNPFLGWRAIRMCFDKPEILNTQLRAIFRASAFGKLKIMFPMVISVEEARRLKAMMVAVKSELSNEGVGFDDHVEAGIMVETPAAVMIADLLIEEVDFFSIGTNDLTQYVLAVDRGNEMIADLYEPMSPAVLRAIKRVIDCSHKAGKWTGMCGEMAGDERAALILAGLGLDEFSMSATSIPRVKKVLREQRFEALQKLANDVVNQPTIKDVQAALDAFIQ